MYFNYYLRFVFYNAGLYICIQDYVFVQWRGMSQAAGWAAQFGVAMPTGQSEPKWVYPENIKSIF